MKAGDTIYVVRDGWSSNPDGLEIYSATIVAATDKQVRFAKGVVATAHRARVPREEVDATMSLDKRGAWLKFGAMLQHEIDALEKKLAGLRAKQEVCAARATGTGGNTDG